MSYNVLQILQNSQKNTCAKIFLNLQSGYLEIEVRFLDLLSHDFLNQIVTLFSSYKS